MATQTHGEAPARTARTPALAVGESLAQFFSKHPERRYVMFGGKGGLGKTTFSAATGYWLAQHGKRVLVFSVDPQASLSDIFQMDIFGKGPVKVMDNLWAQEIDADRHIREYQDEVRAQILGEIQYVRTRINAASRILTDREKTAFFFVVIPEQMILLDTRKAAELFARFEVPVAGYIVNRVLPPELADDHAPAYLRNRIEMQRGQLAEIDRGFGKTVLARIPELER